MLKAILQAVPVPEGLGARPVGASIAGVPRLRLLAQRVGAAQGLPAVCRGLPAHPDQRSSAGQPTARVPATRAARPLHVPRISGGSGQAPRGARPLPGAAGPTTVPHAGAADSERRPV